MVLIEEIQINQTNFKEIFEFLSLSNQVNLLTVKFKDLLLPNRDVKIWSKIYYLQLSTKIF